MDAEVSDDGMVTIRATEDEIRLLRTVSEFIERVYVQVRFLLALGMILGPMLILLGVSK